MSHHLFKLIPLGTIAISIALTLVTAPAMAQILIKNEEATFKFGFQGQFWADWTQDSSGDQGYQQNFYLRRARLQLARRGARQRTDLPRREGRRV